MPTVRQIRWATFRVIVVCAVATLILLILLYLLTGGKLLAPRVALYLYIPDASGLAPGALVRVDGIDVGKVSRVKLSGSSQPLRVVQVTMRVERNRLINIPVDSTADVTAETALGDEFIAIKSGVSPQHVNAGDEIALKPQSNALDLQQFAAGLRTVDATLQAIQEGTSPLGQFVVGEDMYRNVLRRLQQVDTGLHSLEDTTGQIGALLYSDEMYRKIQAPLVTLDQTLQRMQSGQGAIGQMLRDSAQYDQLQSTFIDLRKTVASLRNGSMLQSDELYRDWSRSLESLMRSVDKMNASPLFTSSDTYDNLNGFAREIEKTMREFRQDPRKFLRLKVF